MTTNQAARADLSARAQVTILAVALGILLALIPRMGFNPPDQDTKSYAQTVLAMKRGQNYYSAATASLAARPSQARSVRLPTTSWLLSAFPKWSWVGLESLAWIVAFLIGARLTPRPVLFLGLAGVWFAVANRQGVALYPETYGLPFAMWGFDRLRRGDDAGASLAFLGAFCFRELYAIGLVAGIVARRAWPWFACLGASMFLYGAHMLAVKPYLARIGYEKPFGAEGYSWRMLHEVLSPSSGMVGFLFAAGCLVVAGAVLVRRGDLPFTSLYLGALVSVTLWSLRGYWQTCWVPMLLVIASSFERRKQGGLA